MAVRRRRRTYSKRRPKSKRLPRWGVLVMGLAIGIFAVLLGQYVIDRVGVADSGLSKLFSRKSSYDTSRPGSAVKTATSSKPAKPTFDFYTILPEIETVLPDQEVRIGARASTNKRETGIDYVLQAGSFANFADADRLKAKLALNGLEAHIEKVTIEHRGNFFRVRLGPYGSLAELNTTDNLLARQGISAMKLKVKKTQ